MGEYHFLVKADAVIDKGIITLWSFEKKYPYLVYKSQSGEIRVNTDFTEEKKSEYRCCKLYDRLLAKNIAEYQSLPKEKFESQVYGAWMGQDNSDYKADTHKSLRSLSPQAIFIPKGQDLAPHLSPLKPY